MSALAETLLDPVSDTNNLPAGYAFSDDLHIHRDAILELLGSAPYKRELWHWQFEQREHLQPPLILLHQHKVIGFNGSMPVNLHSSQGRRPAIWSCDFILDPAYRGQGLGQVIKAELKRRHQVIMSLGISEQASPVLLKSGWQQNTEVESFQKILQPRRVRDVALIGIQRFNQIKHSIDTNLSWEVHNMNLYQFSITVLDQLWNSVKNKYHNCISRDGAYISWRYKQHPHASYACLGAFYKETLKALVIYRIDGDRAVLVDYIGPANQLRVKSHLVHAFLNNVRFCQQINCTTSDPQLKYALAEAGFRRTRHQPRFYVWSDDHDQLARNVFIMGGDSDGDMLAASQYWAPRRSYSLPDAVNQTPNRDELRVERWSVEQFYRRREDWQALLAVSQADALFLSWQWVWTWWVTWSQQLRLELCLLVVFDQQKLVLIAPMYLDTRNLRIGLYSRRLQFIGNCWLGPSTMRSEYTDMIVHDDYVADTGLIHLLDHYIHEQVYWNEWIVSDVVKAGFLDHFMNVNQQRYAARYSTLDHAYLINTSGTFEDYLKGLGRNTRLKLYNRRRYLQKQYAIRFETLAINPSTVDEFFTRLNQLHEARWQQSCFDGAALNFNLHLIKQMTEQHSVQLQYLWLDDDVVAAVYNLLVDDTVYNMQIGFKEYLNKKVSVGTLALGYSIEQAFQQPQVKRFDLLAGQGKNSNYKAHLNHTTTAFITRQIIRDKTLVGIYTVYDVFPQRLKRQIGRLYAALKPAK